MAKLYFRYGAMNCGKSTALQQVAYNYEERGMKVVIIKPRIDTKGGDKVISRLGIERTVDLIVDKDEDLYKTIRRYLNEKGAVDCILVDEVQFITRAQVDSLFEIAVKENIPVICYGLRTDFLMNGFEGSERLLLLAHSIEELKTICSCGRKALLNGRKIDGEFVFEGNQVAIENENNVEYESLCPTCYIQKKEKFLDRNLDAN
jgi:thymidine kinase